MANSNDCAGPSGAHTSHDSGNSWTYRNGLTDLHDRVSEYPLRNRGRSNALFISSRVRCLVDTVFSNQLTGGMLDEVKIASNIDHSDIGTVGKAHIKNHHKYGFRLPIYAEMISWEARFHEMGYVSPQNIINSYRAAGSIIDIAQLLLCGQIKFRNRELDIWQAGDTNVEAPEIEPVLNQHAEIANPAIAKKPRSAQDEMLIAYAVPSRNCVGSEHVKMLRCACVWSLARLKMPMEFRIVDEIPNLTMMKIDEERASH